MNQNKSQIISFKRSDIPKIRELYKLSSQKTKPLKIFDYKLSKTPDGAPIGYLMKYEKTIIGFYVIIPITIRIKNKKILGGLSFFTMTHPEYQRKGVFSKLARKTFSTAKKRGYKFVVGFSTNKNSVNGFKKLGFSIKPIYFRKIFLKKNKPKKIYHISKNNTPQEIEKLWENFEGKKQFKIQRIKNKKYFDWRYTKNPIKYFIYFEREQYCIILKKYNEILNVVDFFGNASNLEEIIADITIKKARELNCKKITIWWPKIKNHKAKKYFSKEIQSPNYFAIKKLDSNLTSDILELKNWYFTMSDSDIF